MSVFATITNFWIIFIIAPIDLKGVMSVFATITNFWIIFIIAPIDLRGPIL